MNAFARDVSKDLLPRLQPLGFRLAKQGCVERLVTFVSRYDDDVCFYIFVKDGRPGGANLEVSLWVAPLQFPDESLDRLGVGFKIVVMSEYEVDENFMAWTAQKLEKLVPGLPAIADAVKEEMECPAYATRRFAVYQHERKMYRDLRQRIEAGELEGDILSMAQAVAQGKKAFTGLEQRSLEIADVLSMDTSVFSGKNPAYFLKAAASGLAGQLYIHALLES